MRCKCWRARGPAGSCGLRSATLLLRSRDDRPRGRRRHAGVSRRLRDPRGRRAPGPAVPPARLRARARAAHRWSPSGWTARARWSVSTAARSTCRSSRRATCFIVSQYPLGTMPHLDMLHPARRLWKERPTVAGPAARRGQLQVVGARASSGRISPRRRRRRLRYPVPLFPVRARRRRASARSGAGAQPARSDLAGVRHGARTRADSTGAGGGGSSARESRAGPVVRALRRVRERRSVFCACGVSRGTSRPRAGRARRRAAAAGAVPPACGTDGGGRRRVAGTGRIARMSVGSSGARRAKRSRSITSIARAIWRRRGRSCSMRSPRVRRPRGASRQSIG